MASRHSISSSRELSRQLSPRNLIRPGQAPSEIMRNLASSYSPIFPVLFFSRQAITFAKSRSKPRVQVQERRTRRTQDQKEHGALVEGKGTHRAQKRTLSALRTFCASGPPATEQPLPLQAFWPCHKRIRVRSIDSKAEIARKAHLFAVVLASWPSVWTAISCTS